MLEQKQNQWKARFKMEKIAAEEKGIGWFGECKIINYIFLSGKARSHRNLADIIKRLLSLKTMGMRLEIGFDVQNQIQM